MLGSALVASRFGKTRKALHDETKELIRSKIDNLEQLSEDDVGELVSIINSLYVRIKAIKNPSRSLCSICKNECIADSLYCNKCGSKIV